jgi:hypothetical protein
MQRHRRSDNNNLARCSNTLARPTPLLDRLERMLDKSDRTDRDQQRGADFAREYGPKRIYAKKKPSVTDTQAPRAPVKMRPRLYARWDRSPDDPVQTPERAARGARRCCTFLRALGRELRQAKGRQAAPVLLQLDELVAVHAHYAPTTDELRWLVRRLRDCHQTVDQPPPASARLQWIKPRGQRLLSLDALQQPKPGTPPGGSQSSRLPRSHWRSPKPKQ